ncbi:MAG: hypothetical protein WC188_03970 [Candidatus Caldatribacteriota bacterium]|nr:hypothetical protein [Patescibacteria group bacterium]
MAQQGKLENIFSYSFPANHLLQISIVKQAVEQTYKKEFFCFITLAPGVQGQQGRTFDFTNRITMKVEGHQVTALAHAIRAVIRGQDAMIGQFSIYVDSSKSQFNQGGGGKSLIVQRTQNQKANNAPMLTFFFKAGQSPALGISMNPPMGLAAADIFEFIGKKCLELEFARGPIGAQTGAYENPNISTPQQVPSRPSQETQNVTNNFSGAFDAFNGGDNPFG